MSPWPSGADGVGVVGARALPPHCQPQSRALEWISATFDTCAPTPLALVSTALGSLSFVAWLFAQLPQIYKNYQVQSTAGLSFAFLAVWLLGDTTNLAGAILTRQAAWQILIASYYTCVDLALVFQFIYYTHYRQRAFPPPGTPAARHGGGGGGGGGGRGRSRSPPRHAARREDRPSDPLVIAGRSAPPSDGEGEVKGLFGSFRFGRSPRDPVARRTYLTTDAAQSASPKTVLLLTLTLAVLARASPMAPAPSPYAALHHPADDRRWRDITGTIVSWISTLSYLVSRFPQILKNARRKSTAGLSITLFVAAFFGNFFYSASLLTNPLAWASYPPHGHYGWADAHGSDRRTWVLLALPFFLGAAGVLSLDLTVFIQFLVYGGGEKPIKVVEVTDERGRPAWRRVNGWMRGWVPSPGPGGWRSRFSSRDDPERRPLLGSTSPRLPEGSPRLPGTVGRSLQSPRTASYAQLLPAGRRYPPGSPLGGSPIARSPLSRELVMPSHVNDGSGGHGGHGGDASEGGVGTEPTEGTSLGQGKDTDAARI